MRLISTSPKVWKSGTSEGEIFFEAFGMARARGCLSFKSEIAQVKICRNLGKFHSQPLAGIGEAAVTGRSESRRAARRQGQII